MQAEEFFQKTSPDPYENINATDKLQGYKTGRNLPRYPIPFLPYALESWQDISFELTDTAALMRCQTAGERFHSTGLVGLQGIAKVCNDLHTLIKPRLM